MHRLRSPYGDVNLESLQDLISQVNKIDSNLELLVRERTEHHARMVQGIKSVTGVDVAIALCDYDYCSAPSCRREFFEKSLRQSGTFLDKSVSNLRTEYKLPYPAAGAIVAELQSRQAEAAAREALKCAEELGIIGHDRPRVGQMNRPIDLERPLDGMLGWSAAQVNDFLAAQIPEAGAQIRAFYMKQSVDPSCAWTGPALAFASGSLIVDELKVDSIVATKLVDAIAREKRRQCDAFELPPWAVTWTDQSRLAHIPNYGVQVPNTIAEMRAREVEVRDRTGATPSMEMSCPIGMHVMMNPVIASDGIVYESEILDLLDVAWIGVSPISQVPLDKTRISARETRAKIAAFLQQT